MAAMLKTPGLTNRDTRTVARAVMNGSRCSEPVGVKSGTSIEVIPRARSERSTVHQQAYDWVARYASDELLSVVEFGARDLNGSVRSLFPNADPYVTLDVLPGDGVAVVANAATWQPDREYDAVLACELFEHTAEWPAIVRTAYKACKSGGRLIITTAGPGRPPHSGIDGGWTLHPGEHYANVPAYELERVLLETGWREVQVDAQPSPADTRAVATK
jgi:SAM-dependent methyltransferase